tara:strand:- start:57 stop:242 length:186 start_codon:yes stop_codon:yes gene_type:complete
MKIDTQGMSFGSGNSGRSIQEQRDAIPATIPKEINILSDALKKELKDLIHEVLDEREWRFK